MKSKVYIETTFVSYLTARPSREMVIAGHQQITHEWWDTRRDGFDLCTSELVIREAGAGDPQAAQERLDVLRPIALLATTGAALALANKLVADGAVPQSAYMDGAHIAVAAVHASDYLLTWNCRHLANAAQRSQIEEVCKAAGYRSPIICTPEELMEV